MNHDKDIKIVLLRDGDQTISVKDREYISSEAGQEAIARSILESIKK